MSKQEDNYAGAFTDEGFWAKLGGYAKTAGSEVVEKSMWLFYAFKNEDTPLWAKTTIVGALGYFISPIDAIPDIIPAVGYADDLGVLALAVTTVATSIDQTVRDKTKAKMKDWFGD